MTNAEVWRPVVGWEDCYEVSDMGRMRSLPRSVYSGPGRTRKTSGQILSTNPNQPYPMIRLKRDGVGKSTKVHRLVAEAFLGPRPEGMEVCHNNGDSHDNRLSNLRYDTHSENNRDLLRHGTHFYARRTHCLHGHEYTAENTYWHHYASPVTGREHVARICRICRRQRAGREDA